jgi:hypothetical protein
VATVAASQLSVRARPNHGVKGTQGRPSFPMN